MTRAAFRVWLAGAFVCLTAAVSVAQPTTTTETKKFRVIAVEGNQLVVSLPEGTRELTVPADFRFNVDGKMLSVNELKAGMSGTATITTKTTMVPVTVTEVKNGTVMQNMGTSILVRTEDNTMRMFSQADVDKRGVKIWRDGKPAEISDFRANDRLSATIVTSKPPRVLTEKEVQATLAKSGARPEPEPAPARRRPPVAAQLRNRRPQARRRQQRRQPGLRRPPVRNRGNCPEPPARCRLSASRASHRSWRDWASPPFGAARHASGFALLCRAALSLGMSAARSRSIIES